MSDFNFQTQCWEVVEWCGPVGYRCGNPTTAPDHICNACRKRIRKERIMKLPRLLYFVLGLIVGVLVTLFAWECSL